MKKTKDWLEYETEIEIGLCKNTQVNPRFKSPPLQPFLPIHLIHLIRPRSSTLASPRPTLPALLHYLVKREADFISSSIPHGLMLHPPLERKKKRTQTIAEPKKRHKLSLVTLR